jgi:hypothetical protein
MTCTEARAAMLDADLDALRGAVGGPLASHLGACADCRAAADRIVRVEGAMGRQLGRLAPRRGTGRAAGTVPRRRQPWRWAVPLAAAAGIGALLLVVTRPPAPSPVERRPADAAWRGAGGVSVRAAAGRNVAVFQTDNPDIVVIWFY